ncbi:protein translocase subunit SecD [Gorillibacterium massiliense]|uniref:protein translocase subunit SecD n=1 Tax=Gorillibacterium massiliense TaxID=1280390 RepID=UPI0004ACE0F0|nr:protein translocase subunit SecD [Gorillibacterium massiliense]
MDVKRFTVFLLVIVIMLAGMGISAPYIVKDVKLGLDLKGGFEILYEASPLEAGQEVTHGSLIETANSLEKRVDKSGIAEPSITTEGKNRIRVRLADVQDPNQVRDMLQKPAELTFRDSKNNVVMNGSDFVPNAAKIIYDQTNRPVISIQVKDKEKFADVTGKLTGQPMSIVLDDKVLTSPTVNGRMTEGTAIITGYSLKEAQEYRDIINLGALPLKLSEKYTNAVDATLGKASLHETLIAGFIAFALILAFMIFFYHVPGLLACFTLIVYAWLLLLVLNLMNATLTLPGIAAFILGVGMAVDANIITDERIKEEIRSGKSIMSAYRAGGKVSLKTVIDAHITTILASAVLYFLGTGTVQGFALTLIFSLLVGLLTNVALSRWLLQMLIRSNVLKKPSLFGVKGDEIHAL